MTSIALRTDPTGPLRRFSDLSQPELAEVLSAFILAPSAETLNSFGVMCTHPRQGRAYDGFWMTEADVSFEESRWFDCSLCMTRVVNRGS